MIFKMFSILIRSISNNRFTLILERIVEAVLALDPFSSGSSGPTLWGLLLFYKEFNFRYLISCRPLVQMVLYLNPLIIQNHEFSLYYINYQIMPNFLIRIVYVNLNVFPSQKPTLHNFQFFYVEKSLVTITFCPLTSIEIWKN
jgi:hypothetical protein